MTTITQSLSKEITGLLKKYAIILIVMEFITRWGVLAILRLCQKYCALENIGSMHEMNSLILGLSTFVLNLILAIILLFDLKKKDVWAWILFGWTILNPWTSIIFFLMWRIVDSFSTKNKPI
jgi:hypothetical protein